MRLARAGQRLWWLVRNPVENAARLRERRQARTSGWRPEAAYAPVPAWEAKLHEMLGAPWPCPVRDQFWAVYRAGNELLSQQGLAIGREAYGGWDDADPALARAAWCLVAHLHPQKVLETGVGRGITSRVILEALAKNGSGHLWSVDQPPPLSPGLRRQTAAAVPESLRAEWTYVRGSSRRKLPGTVRRCRELDLFVHDSMHSTRNVGFELSAVWTALVPGGVILVDDINMNRGFELVARGRDGDLRALVGASDDEREMIGVIQKRPADGSERSRSGSSL